MIFKNKDDLEDFIKSNKDIIFSFLKTNNLNELQYFEDAYFGFHKAIEKCPNSSKINFKAYAIESMNKECFSKKKPIRNVNEKDSQLVKALLSILNERDRLIVELYYISNLKKKEIALLFDVSPSLISERIKVSLELLNKKFNKEEG